MSRRAAAIVAILAAATALTIACLAFVAEFPRGFVVPVCVIGAAAFAWLALLRRGVARLTGLVLAALLFGVAIGVLVSGGRVVDLALVILPAAISAAGARAAFAPARSLPRRPAPRRPVLFVNPRSGGGKAAKLGLAGEAARRGFEAVELMPGDDLRVLVERAIEEGADALAMAGGDGSQAVVASLAAAHDLPYACIPAGTRNHFALDLGVDRDDVVGALDAFVDGGERLVDLAEANGRVFVNNVSLGIYAEAVSQEGYREAKLRTMLETLPETLGPGGEALELRWKDPNGAEQRSTALVLVSNNAYQLGPGIGSGTRPRLDEAVLGVVDVRLPTAAGSDPGSPWRQMTMPELEVDAECPIPLGIDGEAITLEPPLRFRIRPGALRVRIARAHPGASPSADLPRGPIAAAGALIRVALRGEIEVTHDNGGYVNQSVEFTSLRRQPPALGP